MSRLVVSTLAFVFVLKVFLLVWIGPVYTDDSPTYAGFADAILRSSHWLHNADLDSAAQPLTTYRPLGYPAVIALAKLCAGQIWAYTITIVQNAVSLVAFVVIVNLGLTVGLSVGAATFAALAWAFFQLPYDQAIMTDSLNANFIIFAVATFLRGSMEGRPLRFGQAAVSGILLAAAFLFRDVMSYLAISLLPLLLIRCGLTKDARQFLRFAPFVFVCLPLAATDAAYRLWNFHRTGYYFVTTIPQTNALTATMYAARYQPKIFSGDSVLEKHARPFFAKYDFPEALKINDALFKDGYRAPEISRMAMDKYLDTWRHHPLAMLTLIQITISESVLKLIVRPIGAVCELFELAHMPPCYDYRDLYRILFHHPRDMDLDQVGMFALITIQNSISITLSALYFFGVPLLAIAALRRDRLMIDRPLLIVAGFWAFGVGWYLIYCEAMYTTRYMTVVLPFMAMGALFAARRLGEHYKDKLPWPRRGSMLAPMGRRTLSGHDDDQLPPRL